MFGSGEVDRQTQFIVAKFDARRGPHTVPPPFSEGKTKGEITEIRRRSEHADAMTSFGRQRDMGFLGESIHGRLETKTVPTEDRATLRRIHAWSPVPMSKNSNCTSTNSLDDVAAA